MKPSSSIHLTLSILSPCRNGWQVSRYTVPPSLPSLWFLPTCSSQQQAWHCCGREGQGGLSFVHPYFSFSVQKSAGHLFPKIEEDRSCANRWFQEHFLQEQGFSSTIALKLWPFFFIALLYLSLIEQMTNESTKAVCYTARNLRLLTKHGMCLACTKFSLLEEHFSLSPFNLVTSYPALETPFKGHPFRETISPPHIYIEARLPCYIFSF